MKIEFDGLFDGLEEFQKNLSDLQKKAESIDGTNEVSFDELFPIEFMKQYTEFQSIEDMSSKGGIDFDSEKEIKLDTDEEWNKFVSKHTGFSSWDSMLEKAAAHWASKKLDI